MSKPKIQDMEAPCKVGQPTAGRLLRLTALLTGLSISLPLASTLIAARFFEGRFENADVSYAFTSFYAATFLGIKLLMAAAQTVLVRKQSTAMVRNCLFGLAAALLCLLLLLVNSAVKGVVLAGWIMVLTLIKAVLVSLIETNALGSFAGCPSSITQSVFIGQGMAGIWTAGVSLLFQFLPTTDPSFFAIVNYGLSLVIVFGCAVSWAVSADGLQAPPKPAGHRLQLAKLKAVGSRMPDLIATVWLSSVLSMAMFPFMIDKTHPSTLSPHLFYPIAFSVSNAADLLGKWLPSVAAAMGPIFRLSLVRVLVFVGLFTGNIVVHDKVLPWRAYRSDAVFMALILVSGVVHGFASTLAAMRAPLRVPEDESLAATLLNLCQAGANFAGSLLSLALAYALKHVVQ